MAESAEQRLEALRKRWEDDRSSKAFVPLAEEYRRMGRLRDALAVLEQGMKVAPNHLSAQVALGRCRFDLGDFAGAIQDFERVVRQDPTQLVANKLLVEAHLRAGNLDQAAERLDIYTLLNNRDPEIESLRERIAVESRAFAVPPVASSATAPSPVPMEGAAEFIAPVTRSGEVFSLPSLRSPAPNLADAVPERRRRAPSAGADNVFSGLGTASDRQRYVQSLLVGGVFGIAPTPAVEEPPADGPIPPAAAAPVEPTATLGELYLSQGHREEAETIFQRVLEHHPDNSVALEGLESARRAGSVEAASGGVTARKISVLQAYLRRLRGSTERHVS
ncbi:MAG: tetratricopeptide repeat protein [Acidobacteriota bacterium]